MHFEQIDLDIIPASGFIPMFAESSVSSY